MTTRDPIDQLTIAELDSGSRLLKTDLVTAIQNSTQDRWQALAIVAYLVARRQDRAAQLQQFRAMTTTELTEALGMGGDDDQVDQVVVTDDQLRAGAEQLGVDVVELCTALGVDAVEPLDVTGPAPVDDQTALEADPTAPTPEPS